MLGSAGEGRLTPFGKYFLLERINVGGMAEVFKAKTVGVEGFEKIVAIKRILPSVAEDEEFIKMFVDEAKITSQLSHANLAQTFDLGKINDTFYIAMEYVPGKDLRAVFERLKRRGERMPLTLAAYVLARVCEGLDYAHRKRDLAGRELHIVHRDVSPQNVILSFEGEVKLIDFGIAKAANKMTKTQAGILKGKFGYMSPEQVRGLELDGRSDIFAAGIVLYELCTGERLFTGTSDYSVLEKVQQAKVTPPSALEPSIPLKLERVILKALARETQDRYLQAADLAADLQRFLLDSRERPVTRDDVAAFMKGMFPDDNAREAQAVIESTRPREQRRPPPDLERKAPVRDDWNTPIAPVKKSLPPPLPRSLTEGLGERDDFEDEVVGENDPDRTFRGPMPEGPPAQIIVRSKVANLADLDSLEAPRATAPPAQAPPRLPPQAPPQLSPQPPPRGEPRVAAPPPLPVLPPMPRLPPLFGGPDDSVSSSISVEGPGDSPTRPMSMDELASSEREFVALQKAKSARDAAALDDEETSPELAPPARAVQPAPARSAQPGSQPVPPPGSPSVAQPGSQPVSQPLGQPRAGSRGAPPRMDPAPVSVSFDDEQPTPADRPARRTPLETKKAPEKSPTRKRPPPPVENTVPDAEVFQPPAARAEASRAEPAWQEPPAHEAEPESAPLSEQKTQVKARSQVLPFGGRMALSKPTLVGDDPARAEEDTVSTAARRARVVRYAQYGIVAVALAIAAWALLSSPRAGSKRTAAGAPAMASLKVTTDPSDAVLLLDGAQVKEAGDQQWSEPRLTAGVEHVLTARRQGYGEQVLPLTLKAGEERTVALQLAAAENAIVVRSSPPGAQIWIDGTRRGQTPAYLPDLSAAQAHAIVIEKKCYRAWQAALPARAGRREFAATLEPAVGACPGRRLEKSEGMPAPEVPDDSIQGTLGFLSLGSRPSANVVIDGVDIGRTTPLLSWPLKPGEHRVRLSAKATAREVAVEIRSGETHSEIVELQAPAAQKRGRR